MAKPYRKQPDDRVVDDLTKPGMGAQIRASLMEKNRVLSDLAGGGDTFVSITSGSINTSYRWVANGPYTVDTSVDGGIIVPIAFTIQSVWFYRTTAGSSGSTILDLNKNGTTLYATQANRPTIAFNDADLKVQATLPDTVAIAAGDILTVDTDQIEAGTPQHWSLVVQGA